MVKPEQEILLKILKHIDLTGKCWIWKGQLDKEGYGIIHVKTHRFIYELLKATIPKDKVIDHLCRNRACCNPDHLEAITNKENILRGNAGLHNKIKTHCKHGHELIRGNLRDYELKRGRRACKKCHNEWGIKYRKRPEIKSHINFLQRERRNKRNSLKNIKH